MTRRAPTAEELAELRAETVSGAFTRAGPLLLDLLRDYEAAMKVVDAARLLQNSCGGGLIGGSFRETIVATSAHQALRASLDAFDRGRT